MTRTGQRRALRDLPLRKYDRVNWMVHNFPMAAGLHLDRLKHRDNLCVLRTGRFSPRHRPEIKNKITATLSKKQMEEQKMERSRRVTPLLAPSLVFSPRRFA